MVNFYKGLFRFIQILFNKDEHQKDTLIFPLEISPNLQEIRSRMLEMQDIAYLHNKETRIRYIER